MTQLKQLFLAHQAQTSKFPLMLEISEANGNYLFDKENKAYLDLISGISVSSLGHNNPNVKNAIIKQLNKHMHVMVYGEFVQDTPTKLCQKLCNLLPPLLDNIYLLNSGAEATDTALKPSKTRNRQT